nr:hypothetical protein Iba_chr01bCG6270 [Ipomoea batatas]
MICSIRSCYTENNIEVKFAAAARDAMMENDDQDCRVYHVESEEGKRQVADRKPESQIELKDLKAIFVSPLAVSYRSSSHRSPTIAEQVSDRSSSRRSPVADQSLRLKLQSSFSYSRRQESQI